jgi:LemA protein
MQLRYKVRIRFLILLCLASFLSSCRYKKLVTREEKVNQAWSVMENYFQERVDLASKIIEDNANDAAPKDGTIRAIADARLKVSNLALTMNPGDLNQQYVTQYEDAQSELDSSILSYCTLNLKNSPGNPDIISIKKELDNKDHKINEAVLLYNEAALEYNSSRQRVWNIMMAKLGGFKPKGYFYNITADKKTNN